VEFKQPNKNNLQRAQLNVPRRDAPLPITPLPPSTPTHIPSKGLGHSLGTRRNVFILGIVLVVLMVGLLIHHLAVSSKTVAKPIYTLNYATILPEGKTIKQLGGWVLVSPPGISPVYAYTDTLGGISISVSEQPLPASFKTNTDDQIAELSKGYNADDSVNAKGTVAYIGTSSKGPQSVIFTKNSILLLIKSSDVVSDTTWQTYIASLQ
jgi:hypothetical protein